MVDRFGRGSSVFRSAVHSAKGLVTAWELLGVYQDAIGTSNEYTGGISLLYAWRRGQRIAWDGMGL